MNQSNRCALAASVLVLSVALLSSPAFAQAPVAGAAPDLATRVADALAHFHWSAAALACGLALGNYAVRFVRWQY